MIILLKIISNTRVRRQQVREIERHLAYVLYYRR